MKEKLLLIIKNDNSRKFFIYGIGQAFNLLSPLIVAPLIVAVCLVEGFGKVGLAYALCLFLILIVDYAFDIKGTKTVAENRHNIKELQKILFTTITTKIILFCFSMIVGLLLIFTIPFFYLEKNLFLLSFIIVFAQVFNPIWFLQGLEDFVLSSILNICSKSVYVFLIFNFIQQKNDYIYVNFLLGVSALIFNVLGLIILYKKYKLGAYLPKKLEIKLILKNDFSFSLSQLVLSIRQLSPLVLTSYFLGYSLAGQYKIIEQIISLFRTFCQVFFKFFYPKVCYLYKINPLSAFLFWKKYTIIVVLFVTLCVCILYFNAEMILTFFHLNIIYIPKVSEVFKISLSICFLMSISLALEQLMFIMEKNKVYIKTTIFVSAINLLIIFTFIQKFELYAVIASLIIAELLFVLIYTKNTIFKSINKRNEDSY